MYSLCRHGPFALQVGDDTFDPSHVANGDFGPAFEQVRQAPGLLIFQHDLAGAEVLRWNLPAQLAVLHLQMAGFALLFRNADLVEDAQAVEPANGAGSQTENRVFSS